MTVYGSYFSTTEGTVSFGGSTAEIDNWSDTAIRVLVPAHLCPAKVKVTANSLDSSQAGFTVTGRPPGQEDDPEECPKDEDDWSEEDGDEEAESPDS